MSMTDPIADLLTRIRNATRAKHRKVDIPASNLKKEVCGILLKQGYIKNWVLTDETGQGTIRVYLKYDEEENSVITGIKRVSTPGLRRYVGKKDLPRVMNNLGIAIVSTSKGVMTSQEARQAQVGGEVLCYVW